MATVVLVVAVAASASLACLAWLGLRRLLPGSPVIWSPRLRLAIGGAALLFGAGVTWGLPGGKWAPDELWPGTILQGLTQHFSHGWYDIYPPFHYQLLSAVTGPVLLADAVGALALTPEGMDDLLWLMNRSVSLAMAIGLLVLMARFAQQCAGRDYGWPVVLCAGASLPLVFYAKLGNLDVPYVFWFVASLLWFRAAMEGHDGLVRPLVGFAVTATLAVTTKDQAYGLYGLPLLLLAYQTARRPGGVRALMWALVAAGVVFASVHNIWFNPAGFRNHVTLIMGDGSEGYRLVPATLAGEWALLRLTTGQLFWCLGIPGVVLLALGLWQQWRHGIWPNWLWLFPLSYALTFLAVIGYVYDRFLIGPALILSLLSASGLRLLLERGRAGQVAGVFLGAWLVWRVVSVDVLVLRDSRYVAEDWFRENVAPDSTVVTTFQASYLPRFRGYRHSDMYPTREATVRANPDVIVVNVEFVNRYPAAAPQPMWLAWLESGEAGYREVFRYKAPLTFTELAWWPTFRDRRQTMFTNLDKANPEIVIFQRR